MSANRREDALALVYWYSSQPHHATKLDDRDISIELGWTFTKKTDIPHPTKRDRGVILGDANRVRRARQYVDSGRDDMFAGYTFGTRENGGGVSYSRLKSPDDKSLRDESGRARHLASQLARLVQGAAQHAAEIARDVILMRELLEQMKTNADPVDRILALGNAVRDLETFGRIQPQTHWEMVKAGVPIGTADAA